MAVSSELPALETESQAPASAPAPRRGLRYNSPLVQVSLIGLVCFCCPGMFNALSGLGGGGQFDHTTADNANTALYACFAVFGVLGGAAHNLLGPRITLLLGSLTYPLYAASFLYYNHHKSQIFPVTAGALLGAGAGLLWAAQGAIMTSYPPPNRRGSYISLFWCLFNLGGVLGGLLPFSFNYTRTDAGSVNSTSQLVSSPQDTFIGNEASLSAPNQGMLQRQMSGGVPIHGHVTGAQRQQQQGRQQLQTQQQHRPVVQGSVYAHPSNSGPGR